MKCPWVVAPKNYKKVKEKQERKRWGAEGRKKGRKEGLKNIYGNKIIGMERLYVLFCRPHTRIPCAFSASIFSSL